MSLIDFIVPVSSQTDGTEEYDHEIVLVDATKPVNPDSGLPNDEGSISLSRAGTGTQLSKRWTKSTLREELVRRKYAKWQEDKAEDTDEPLEISDGDQSPATEGPSLDQPRTSRQSPSRTGRLRDKNPFKRQKGRSKRKGNDTGVDILYENQRGSFFCGIPLYSGRSLLPSDPSGWQTATFKYSPVNITNAQLPDPSWVWAWRTWYVDMSYDVDEEGWQYSFSFGQWAWHGTHPWFHSFVRRRRWLRKRVKLYPSKAFGDAGNLKQAHLLNEDYFTIHASRDRSRGSSADRSLNHRSSHLSHAGSDSDDEQDPGDVSDVLKLMGALKRARVDREKLWAVKAFVEQGGDELFYLADRIDDIMDRFIYRTSRMQLHSLLLQEYRANQKQKRKDNEEALVKKDDALSKAVRAAKEYLDSDFRGDPNTKKAGLRTEDEIREERSVTEANIKSGDISKDESDQNDESVDGESTTTKDDEIEGIPASEEPILTLNPTQEQIQKQAKEGRPSFLGKGKEKT